MQNMLIPAPAVAMRLGFSRERVVRLIVTGRIRGESLGGRWFVAETDLEAYIASERDAGQSAGAA